MRWKEQKETPHVCTFNKANKTLDSLFPRRTRLGIVRRKFRESVLVSEENGRRMCCPKGTAGYLFEKEKHLRQHYYMIHPYSKFREYWEIAMIIEIILGLTIRTFINSQLRQEVFSSIHYQSIAFVCDLMETTDATILRFMTGYLDVETRNVALETRRVFLYSVKQIRFPLNLLSSLPFEFLIFFLSERIYIYPPFKFPIFLKILKLADIYRYLTHISKIYNWSELTFRTVWIVIAMSLLCQWLSCFFYVIIFGSEFGEPNNKFEKSDNCFYRHFSIIYLISTVLFFQNGFSNHLVINSTKDMLLMIFLLLITHLSNVVFLGLLIQILGLMNTSFIQYQEMIQEVQKFLIQENLPKHINKKVIGYFEFRFRRNYFREKIILETLSPPLRQEIANFLCMDLIANPRSIFRDAPKELANALCLKLKFETFLAGDVVTRAGKEAKNIYFIFCGTITLYSQKGKEIAHLYEGQQFGTVAFSMTENPYQTTAIALETSELYILRYRDFLSCSGDYAEYRNVVAKAARMRGLY